MSDFVKFGMAFGAGLISARDGLHHGENLTLACGFFPAMARAIEGKIITFSYINPVFDAAFCASATAQD